MDVFQKNFPESDFKTNGALWIFQRLDDGEFNRNVKEEEDDLYKYRKEYILCRLCKNRITVQDSMTKINGQHLHTFKNPAGIEYQIGCFSSAEGCLEIGDPTNDFTWFPGYAWSFAVCSKCNSHMGWYYSSGDNGFYGLIIENIVKS